MKRNLLKRLERLESHFPRERTREEMYADFVLLFLISCIANYLGDPTPEGPMIEAAARGLGYSYWFEFGAACLFDFDDVLVRTEAATEKLFAKFGVDSKTFWLGDPKALDVVEEMAEGLSGSIREHSEELLREFLQALRRWEWRSLPSTFT